MYQEKVTVINNQRLGPDLFRAWLRTDKIAVSVKPGQFVDIRINDGDIPLLRRPFGIHDVKGRELAVLYQVLGKGTGYLSKKKSGDVLDVIGPLGNGFDLIKPRKSEKVLLAAGGMGIAPLFFLAKKIAEIQNPKSKIPACRQANKIPISVIIGAKDKGHILCEKGFKDLGCDVKISTDDGSQGFKGYVSGLLVEVLTELRTKNHELRAIYACGPKPMLREISLISREKNIPAQLSLESHLACGIGACLGCVINTTQGYKRVCKEGPVFDSKQVVW